MCNDKTFHYWLCKVVSTTWYLLPHLVPYQQRLSWITSNAVTWTTHLKLWWSMKAYAAHRVHLSNVPLVYIVSHCCHKAVQYKLYARLCISCITPVMSGMHNSSTFSCIHYQCLQYLLKSYEFADRTNGPTMIPCYTTCMHTLGLHQLRLVVQETIPCRNTFMLVVVWYLAATRCSCGVVSCRNTLCLCYGTLQKHCVQPFNNFAASL